MAWSDDIVESLRAHDIWLVSYVPDAIGWQVLSKLEQDPSFKMVPAAREEECVAIVAGAYAAQKRGAVFVQSSGFGNTVNSLAQLAIAHRIPVPLFIGMRGGLGEFNPVQVPSAQPIPKMLDAMNVQHYAPEREEDVTKTVGGAIELCYASRFPVAVLLYSSLVGAKKRATP
ncbi:MAG: thiamine pyrophosphate-binding protein [Dehalococcoidia bacterium]